MNTVYIFIFISKPVLSDLKNVLKELFILDHQAILDFFHAYASARTTAFIL
jgi:hypothetical protein